MDRRAVRGHAASEHGGDERDGGAAAAVSSGKLLKARRHRGRQQQQQQVQTCKTDLWSEIQTRIATTLHHPRQFSSVSVQTRGLPFLGD